MTAGSRAYKRAVARIEWVNEHAQMADVLGLLGIRTYDGDRIDCPACGEDSSMYVHGHWAMCFGCHPWEPAEIYAGLTEMPRGKAAREIAARLGLAPGEVPPPDTSWLESALNEWCALNVTRSWVDLRREQDTAQRLADCGQLLPLVHTEDDARLWLATAREAMRRHLTAKGVLR